MEFNEIISIIQSSTRDDIFSALNTTNIQPYGVVVGEDLLSVCEVLYNHPSLFFDFLTCVTGIDNGIEKNTLEVIYHFYSIPFQHQLVLIVILPRTTEPLPSVPSIANIWQGANWHEREAAEMFGIHFENHPDLRKLLLPNDWQGFPLRKDYKTQEEYHGIKVDY